MTHKQFKEKIVELVNSYGMENEAAYISIKAEAKVRELRSIGGISEVQRYFDIDVTVNS